VYAVNGKIFILSRHFIFGGCLGDILVVLETSCIQVNAVIPYENLTVRFE